MTIPGKNQKGGLYLQAVMRSFRLNTGQFILIFWMVFAFGAIGQDFERYLPAGEKTQCYNSIYQQELLESLSKRKSDLLNRIKSRNLDERLQVHLHIDTSYERRRVGGYHQNQDVINYMNGLVSNVVTKFNVAAPNWDLEKDLTITFFDGATPFSYGQNLAETIENYLYWLISINFPGNDDVYVLYTGHYTNAGISYLGTLCWPGVTLVGFVNSLISNEALSSHEWVGHSAGALHYDQSVNVMNSSNASFPWHISSLEGIEDFLEDVDCVANFQAPLVLEGIRLSAYCLGTRRILEWECTGEVEGGYFEIKKSFDRKSWFSWDRINASDGVTNFAVDFESGKYSYVKIEYRDANGFQLSSNVQSVPLCYGNSWQVQANQIFNPGEIRLKFYNSIGQLLFESNDREILIDQNLYRGIIHVTDQVNTETILLGQ
ncbi:MAG: hypothetical protein IPM48_06495 [Saprospiraceae bacterium]|nr:hypothetical protein [Saprospiraceae bacterium]